VSSFAIIVAGGTGERFGSPDGKQLAEVAGRPVVAWSVAAFEECADIEGIVVVAHPDRVAMYAAATVSSKVRAVVAGGATRQESVAAGIAEVPEDADAVAVHDGARPLVTPAVVAEALRTLREDPDVAGVVVGHPMFDTVKRVEAHVVTETVDRNGLWVAQTPQVFRYDLLARAFAAARQDGFIGTDEASLVERLEVDVTVVLGSDRNIKITKPGDMDLARLLLQEQAAPSEPAVEGSGA
jgi:2-C-methyl-D-erythritol 4-phosphate cytidylyltransferase